MSNNTIKIKKLHDDVQLPMYATVGSAGFDLVAHNFKEYYDDNNNPTNSRTVAPETESILIVPSGRVLIGTGLSMEIPIGHELQIRSRSGLSLKAGIIVLNAPGTIDSDYRGEVGIILYNASSIAYTISKGDKIAQAIFAECKTAEFTIESRLQHTDRGHRGFGSTGL